MDSKVVPYVEILDITETQDNKSISKLSCRRHIFIYLLSNVMKNVDT